MTTKEQGQHKKKIQTGKKGRQHTKQYNWRTRSEIVGPTNKNNMIPNNEIEEQGQIQNNKTKEQEQDPK